MIIIYNKLSNFWLVRTSLLIRYSFSKKWNVEDYLSFPVQEYDVGQRLDRYLKNTAIGWIKAQKYLREKDIFVLKSDGEVNSTNSHKFQLGDKLMVRKEKEIEQKLIGNKNINYIQMDQTQVNQKLNSMIIFDNENLTVLNKKAAYSVQGGPDPHFNLFSLMASRFKKDMIYISHRLDKPTTGIVIISKNLNTAQILGKVLESKCGFEKYYLAMTQGRQIKERSGTIKCNLEWTSKHKARITESVASGNNTQLSETNYVKLRHKQLNDILWRNLLGLKLVTGKKHQIRCHLSQYLLNPIINDELYLGKKQSQYKQSIFLHSFALKITDIELIQRIFGIKDKAGTLVDNNKGLIKIINNELLILGRLHEHWAPYKQSINDQLLEQMVAKIQINKSKSQGIKKSMKLQ